MISPGSFDEDFRFVFGALFMHIMGLYTVIPFLAVFFIINYQMCAQMFRLIRGRGIVINFYFDFKKYKGYFFVVFCFHVQMI